MRERRGRRWGAILILVILGGYIAAQLVPVLMRGYETQTAVSSTLADSVPAKGIAVREEQTLEYSGSDLTAVGRLRMDPRFPDEIQLWCCFDQLRKGAATNAVQIAEWALEQGWLRKERRTS